MPAKYNYNPKVTIIGKKRIRDVIYRMKKAGYILPVTIGSDIKTIKDTSSYTAIERQIAKIPGTEFRAKTWSHAIPATEAQPIIEQIREYNKKASQLHSHKGIITSWLSAGGRKITIEGIRLRQPKGTSQSEITKQFKKTAKALITTITARTPQQKIIEQYNLGINNISKAFDRLIQNHPQLKAAITDKIKQMNPAELSRFMNDRKIQTIFEDFLFSYREENATQTLADIANGTPVLDAPGSSYIHYLLEKLGIVGPEISSQIWQQYGQSERLAYWTGQGGETIESFLTKEDRNHMSQNDIKKIENAYNEGKKRLQPTFDGVTIGELIEQLAAGETDL